ncbi:MAG: sensor histidine kinase [Byssovorax sp.]
MPHLRPPLDVTAEDEAAFAQYAVELTADYAVVGASFMIAVILAWWPIDGLIRADARYLEGFASMRARGLVLELVTLGVFLVSSRARRASLVVVPLFYAALLALIGHSLGRIGDADLSWLADATLGIMPAALLPYRLGPRVGATLLIGLALPAGFFLPFVAGRHDPAVNVQLSFIAFALFATVVLGEIIHRLVRRAFFQQRSLGRARADLAGLNLSLTDRVATQTVELRSLAGHLDRVQESERRRISRDLHDDLAQELTAMRYTLERLDARHGEHPESVGELVSDLSALLEGTTATVRGFISELRPRVLDDLGLIAAAEWLCERAGSAGEITCQLTVAESFPDVDDGLDAEIALTLFRVLQEATTNARRHARARAIEIALRVRDDGVVAEVKDDGEGFDPSTPAAGFGLLGIRERVRGAGGSLVVDSAPGRGTRVAATVPARLVVPSRGSVRDEATSHESAR